MDEKTQGNVTFQRTVFGSSDAPLRLFNDDGVATLVVGLPERLGPVPSRTYWSMSFDFDPPRHLTPAERDAMEDAVTRAVSQFLKSLSPDPITADPPPHTHAMPGLGICGECWGENPGAALFPAVAIGMRCDRHEVTRLTAPIVDKMLAPLRAAMSEQRWHEIAREGLPPEGDYFTWDGTSVEQLALVLADGRAYWTDPFGVDSAMEYEVRNAARITHWQPVVKPAPPTKEPT